MYRKLGFGFIVVCFIVLLTACDGMPAPGGGIGAEPSATAQGRPVVIVNAPPDGSTVPVGSEVLVDSTALDAVGVARVDLAVNGSVVRSDSPPDGTPLAEFDALQPWLAEELGVFLLSLTAYRADGTASEPVSLTVNVAEENGEGVTGDEPTVTATADLAATGGPTHTPTYTPTGPTPTGGGTPTYTPTATATLNVTATYTPTSTLAVTSTATPTPTYTPTSPPAAQVAPEDARFNSPLTIPLDSTASVTDFVSYPGGDREDRVAWDISGMNSNAALSGGRAQLTIAVSCFGTGTQQIQFFTGGQTFSCGQTIVDREVTSDSRTGQVTITAVGGENTYVQWVLTGTATRLN